MDTIHPWERDGPRGQKGQVYARETEIWHQVSTGMEYSSQPCLQGKTGVSVKNPKQFGVHAIETEICSQQAVTHTTDAGHAEQHCNGVQLFAHCKVLCYLPPPCADPIPDILMSDLALHLARSSFSLLALVSWTLHLCLC